MKFHNLKIEPKWFELHLLGLKSYEIRKNDRDFRQGDFLVLEEYENRKYTGRKLILKIKYVATGLPYLLNDVVVLTIEKSRERKRRQ